MQKLQNIPSWLKNRYVVASLAFAVWVAFFDQHDLISQLSMRAELYQLEQDKEYYQREIIETREDLQELLSDNDKLEKFAREKYYMKRPNEEIFVLVEEE